MKDRSNKERRKLADMLYSLALVKEMRDRGVKDKIHIRNDGTIEVNNGIEKKPNETE